MQDETKSRHAAHVRGVPVSPWAQTLDEVMQNVSHRSTGTGGVDTLSSAADRAKLVKFLMSIDERTPIFP